jgi:hypothetical protein
VAPPARRRAPRANAEVIEFFINVPLKYFEVIG